MELSAFVCKIESGKILSIPKLAFTSGAKISVSHDGFSISFLQAENRIPIKNNESISFFILKPVFAEFMSVKDKKFIRKIKS
jgi:hypothetical protein